MQSIRTLPAAGVILLIKFYRSLISPLFPPSCRFYPSCSQYSIEALREHGLFKGLALSVWRIIRCNPFSDGGYDPVPGRKVVQNADPGEHADSNAWGSGS